MDIDIPEEGRLTTEEVRQSVEGGENLTDEQVETIKDFVSLVAVITYEALKKEAQDLNNREQKHAT